MNQWITVSLHHCITVSLYHTCVSILLWKGIVIIIIIIIIDIVYRPPPLADRVGGPSLSLKVITLQHKLDFQLRKLASFEKQNGNHICFFKDSFSFWPTPLIFELSECGYITFIEFQCDNHSPPIEGVFKKTNMGCFFYLHFGKFDFETKLYLYFITTGANKLHVCPSSGIMNMNLFLVHSWSYI